MKRTMILALMSLFILAACQVQGIRTERGTLRIELQRLPVEIQPHVVPNEASLLPAVTPTPTKARPEGTR